MGILYVNPKGRPWVKHSYSAGNTWDQCPLQYYLQKIQGWKEKNNWARFEFGKAFEAAVQFYHENFGDKDFRETRFMEELKMQENSTSLPTSNRRTQCFLAWIGNLNMALSDPSSWTLRHPALTSLRSTDLLRMIRSYAATVGLPESETCHSFGSSRKD